MKLHLVGGFLGSGKTTAIIGACRELVTLGKSVGVVTNDQGRYLVDTAFFRAAALPTVEVTGGCFCCNFSDLSANVRSLEGRATTIFAESVGSCADVVATVVNPIRAGLGAEAELASFSVFVDARLLRERLAGRPLPFSADVAYIFDEQIEESARLVVNKLDLIGAEDRAELAERVRARFSDKPVLFQSSLDAGDIRGWLRAIEEGEQMSAPAHSLDIDYDRYGAGEASLAWYDGSLRVRCSAGRGPELVDGLFSALRDAVERTGWPIGHLKIHARGKSGSIKHSVTGADGTGISSGDAPAAGRDGKLPDSEFELVVNARIETSREALSRLIHEVVERSTRDGDRTTFISEECFHPSFPRPEHRLP